jgi:hypothetical protein
MSRGCDSSLSGSRRDVQCPWLCIRENHLRATTVDFRLLGLSGSIRRDSTNTAILRSLSQERGNKASLTLFPLNDVPLYNGDLDGELLPQPVRALKDAIARSDSKSVGLRRRFGQIRPEMCELRAVSGSDDRLSRWLQYLRWQKCGCRWVVLRLGQENLTRSECALELWRRVSRRGLGESRGQSRSRVVCPPILGAAGARMAVTRTYEMVGGLRP